MYKIIRLFLLPIGLLTKLFDLSKDGARDLHNNYRFKGAIIDKGCSFTADSTVGRHSHILSGVIINHSHIGNYTYCSRNTLIQNTTIGNYCSIANDVIIGLGKHPIQHFSTSTLFYRNKNTLGIDLVDNNLDFDEYEDVIIGNDVWIGARAIIMDGVKINQGAIVAANSVVTKDVPPYAIVGGVPAKVLKYRFKEEKIETLLNSEWWNNDLQAIKSKMKILNEL